MKITMNELRYVVREALSSDGPQTVSSDLSPSEKELAAAFPTGWRHGSSHSMKAGRPLNIKHQLVAKALSRMGYGDDTAKKKVITQHLGQWLEAMDPSELLVADAEELAMQFATEKLS